MEFNKLVECSDSAICVSISLINLREKQTQRVLARLSRVKKMDELTPTGISRKQRIHLCVCAHAKH